MAPAKREAGVPDGNETFSRNSEDAKKVMQMFKDKTILMSDTAGQVQKRFAEFHKYKKNSFSGGYNAIRRDMNSDSLSKHIVIVCHSCCCCCCCFIVSYHFVLLFLQ